MVILIIALLLLAVVILRLPPHPKSLVSKPRPAQNYEEAIKRVEALQNLDTPAVNPVCRTLLLTHQQKVERVIVLLHGYTNCPQQFRHLGTKFFELGYNVLIPRAPHNGLADRLTQDQAKLTAEELVALTDEAVDIAQGLGEHVTVAGLSMGGVMAGWAAQYRRDIDQAVLISPTFGLYIVPTPLTALVTNLVLLLPNFYRWWHPALGVDGPPPQGYPRLASRGLAQILRLALATQAAAQAAKPATPAILVVTNASDTAVNNKLTADIGRSWQNNGLENLRTYKFEAVLQFDHDVIDPAIPDQHIELIYPILVELINR
ncbi:MAG: alpha/beta fold hydrolase [Anaerolineae bacterium]|nr:alpha/beta fold hydrolase [Anaerolineae bacterium]